MPQASAATIGPGRRPRPTISADPLRGLKRARLSWRRRRAKKGRPKAALKEAREGDRRLYAAVIARRPFPALRSADSPSPPKPTSISAQVEGSGSLPVAIAAVMEILLRQISRA